MSRVRSRRLLMLSVVLLATSVSLGAVLVHDAEVGSDAQRIAQAQPGEEVHLKGVLVPYDGAWLELEPLLANETYRLAGDLEATVLVTALDDDPPEDVQVITGTVLWRGEPQPREPPVVVIAFEAATEPVLFG